MSPALFAECCLFEGGEVGGLCIRGEAGSAEKVGEGGTGRGRV